MKPTVCGGVYVQGRKGKRSFTKYNKMAGLDMKSSVEELSEC